MSRGEGQSQTKSQRGKRVLERCKRKDGAKNMIIIDVDDGKDNDVIIIDIPESSQKRSQVSPGYLDCRKVLFDNIISIDDDCESSDYEKTEPNQDSEASSSKFSNPSSSPSHNVEEYCCDECQFIPETNFPVKLSRCKWTYSEKELSENCAGLSPVSGSYSSESDSSDCELMEGYSGDIREQWERASIRKRTFQDVMNGDCGFDGQASLSRCYSHTAKNSEVEELSTLPVEQPFSTARNGNDGKQGVLTSRVMEDDVSVNPYFYHEADDFVDKMHENVDCDNSWSASELQENPQFLHRNFNVNNSQYSCYETDLQNGARVNNNKTIFYDTGIATSEPYLASSHQRTDLKNHGASHLRTQPEQDGQPTKDADTSHDDGMSALDREKSDERQVDYVSETHRDKEEEEYFFSESESLNATNFVSAMFNSKERVGAGDVCFSKSQQGGKTKINDVTDEPVSGKCYSLNTEEERDKTGSLEEVRFYYRQPLCRAQHLFNAEQVGTSFTYERSCAEVREELPESQVENIHLLNAEDCDERCDTHNFVIGEREKFKQTEEYKRAAEEEWASRHRQLQIQAEEARRMRKRKKAETLRLLDMERRQKQRLEEIRETNEKNVETINLKEQLRSLVRKELGSLEMTHNDMVSLLRCLGIHVGGGPFPTSREVNAAYKQALLRFHPDRVSRTDIKQQVEAEEKFKLISRLKEKLLPSSCDNYNRTGHMF
ncbi:hypothetical protein Syun_023170 [Stephania yunnanensis]|uniref:J domain-containing protein n=1 Tax=Stephania yunnanensis TaxID=152371 RepID=A0AAP0I3M6_9MAGN